MSVSVFADGKPNLVGQCAHGIKVGGGDHRRVGGGDQMTLQKEIAIVTVRVKFFHHDRVPALVRASVPRDTLHNRQKEGQAYLPALNAASLRRDLTEVVSEAATRREACRPRRTGAGAHDMSQ